MSTPAVFAKQVQGVFYQFVHLRGVLGFPKNHSPIYRRNVGVAVQVPLQQGVSARALRMARNFSAD
jgi:hypothetical protein